jgi:hypothetical protein
VQFLGQCPQGFLQLSATHPLLKAPMTGLIRWILGRQFPPLRPGAQNPQHPIQHRARVLRRPTAPVLPPPKSQQRLHYRPFLVADFSAPSHGKSEKRLSLPLSPDFPDKPRPEKLVSYL